MRPLVALLRDILLVAVLLFGAWAFLAFVEMEARPSEWTAVSRAVLALLALVLGGGAGQAFSERSAAFKRLNSSRLN